MLLNIQYIVRNIYIFVLTDVYIYIYLYIYISNVFVYESFASPLHVSFSLCNLQKVSGSQKTLAHSQNGPRETHRIQWQVNLPGCPLVLRSHQPIGGFLWPLLPSPCSSLERCPWAAGKSCHCCFCAGA